MEEAGVLEEYHYTTAEITSQMARRIAYQLLLTDEDPTLNSKRLCMSQMEVGYRELPAEWMKIANEWCRDHKLKIGHGIMALLHLKSMFGMDFSDIVLRVILDDAWEIAKTIEVVRK